MSRSITVKIALGDSYNSVESAEVKVEVPDTEMANLIYTQLRSDLRRLEDDVRERVTTLMTQGIVGSVGQ